MKNNIDKLFFASLAAAFWSVQASAQFLPRGITEVTDNLYWAHQDSHRTVNFLKTAGFRFRFESIKVNKLTDSHQCRDLEFLK